VKAAEIAHSSFKRLVDCASVSGCAAGAAVVADAVKHYPSVRQNHLKRIVQGPEAIPAAMARLLRSVGIACAQGNSRIRPEIGITAAQNGLPHTYGAALNPCKIDSLLMNHKELRPGLPNLWPFSNRGL
jgi:hypothetical protein